MNEINECDRELPENKKLIVEENTFISFFCLKNYVWQEYIVCEEDLVYLHLMNLQYETLLEEKLRVLEYRIADQDQPANYNNPNEKQFPMI